MLVVLFLAGSLAVFLLLYVAIESETNDPTVVDRETAEREAMARGGHRGEGGSGRDRRSTLADDRDRGRDRDRNRDEDDRDRWG